ncbi:MAG TPA: DUF917 family protein [Candidatus Dormibacteraeota bacterium]|nr:DUF917 family protein [Candidatus Dormibacteraeota bacterium]
MIRELNYSDAVDGIWGGSVLACGGGGWVSHGELMAETATKGVPPILCSVDEIPDDAIVVTVTAIGAPGAADWEIQPIDYVNALKLVMERAARPVAAVLTAQNGASTTLNGWYQSALLGVKVLDAAGDVRAHPTGKLGGMGLTDRPGYTTIQAVAGGNRKLHGELRLVAEGSIVTTSNVLRDVSVRVGGFIAAARNPVEAEWVKKHAAIGAITYALDLGRAMRKAEASGAGAVIDAACAQTGGTIIAEGPVRITSPRRTEGGFDHGAFTVDGVALRYLNEYMTVDRGAQRVATYPDVITTLSMRSGRPASIAEIAEGDEVGVFHVHRKRLPLSSSTRDRIALAEVEQIMGVELIRPVEADAGS